MPMYYPDLYSVKRTAEMMSKQLDESKKYNGIIPKNEEDLPETRKQLGAYMRNVWGDEIAALEIELAVTEENYHKKLRGHIASKMFMS